MSDEIAHAILDTLRCADVFDYALSRAETQRYLIGVATCGCDCDFTASSCQNDGRETPPKAQSQYLMRDGQT